nr:hypothetical protein [Chloroflexota bacterium]
MDKQTLERLKVDRIHIAPRALERSPLEVQHHYSHIWAPLDELLGQLRIFPSGLARFWLQQPGGHVVLTQLPSGYVVGEQRLKQSMLLHVAYVRLSDWVNDPLEALVPIGHLVDHLLGSAGSEEGPWLSEGGGINPALQKVGASIVELFSLGYSFDAEACRDARTYFARSLALYLRDRRALNITDPVMERLLRTTLFADAFWRWLEKRN